jgi:predicted nuclease of predicted toxin-antitoxin system
VIFIDRSIPRGVAEAVRRMREDVIWLEDEFTHDVPDEEWLAEAGRQGWLVITHDRKIRTRPGERRAILENGVGCFIMTYRQDLKKDEIVALISSTLQEMERRFEETPRPFIYTVSKGGEFREYARRRDA